ncbi:MULTISPECIES: Cna B-type domain-containing protein [unclassified Enterococcus]|uniref:Cna B-type domain-containing protein n=1 Tax=unclassified Enterococcus TaxID=2608891 RepID=UPI0013EA526E|nr:MULTISPECIES: Cna B-type domain-containing protein [unclassified Enterococcus]
MGKYRNICLTVLFILSSIVSLTPRSAHADAGRDISKNVTSLSVDPADARDGENVKVKFTFDEKAQNIQPGDYLLIHWPSEGSIRGEGFQKEIPLVIEGKNVGTLIVKKDSAQVIFNDNIKNLDAVEGWGQFEIQARNISDTAEENTGALVITSGDQSTTVNVKKPASGGSASVFYYKTGDMLPEDTQHIRWFLNINNNASYVEQEVRITDAIQSGQRLEPSTFEVSQNHLGVQKVYRGEEGIQQFLQDFPGAVFNYSVDENNIEITIPKNLVNLRKILVSYKTTIENPGQENFDNHSNAWFKEFNKPAVEGESFDHTVKNISASGGINGTVRGELKISKYIDGTEIGIPGVTFELRRADERLIQGQASILLTTTELGEADIKGLPVGDYLVKEKEAPDWIDFDPLQVSELRFTINENDTEGVHLPIYNQKKVADITANKSWDGGQSPRPSIYFQLFRESINGWEKVPEAEMKRLDDGVTSVTWQDIQQYDDSGNPYRFKVQEVDQAGNDFVPEGYQKTENGLVVTNRNIETVSIDGQKTWEDNENEAGKRPATITVNLWADGEQIQREEVSEKDGWAYHFANLPKYKDGQEISYTVTEDAVSGYETTIEGYNIKNSYIPPKTEKVKEDGKETPSTKNPEPEKKEPETTPSVKEEMKEVSKSENPVNFDEKKLVDHPVFYTPFIHQNKQELTNVNHYDVFNKVNTADKHEEKKKETSTGKLPKTGSEKSMSMLMSGILLVMISGGLWMRKRL